MKMPKMQPDNYEEIYKYFQEFQPNPIKQDRFFRAMHRLFPATVSYEGGAGKQIQSHLSGGGSIILAPNHIANPDSLVIASIAVSQPYFEGIKGSTTIPGKEGLFRVPGLGEIIQHIPCHPAFRGKSFKEYDDSSSLKDRVGSALVQFNIDYINNGGHVAIFSEGRVNKDNPREVQKMMRGIGRIATGVDDPTNLLIVPMGIAYGLCAGPIHLEPFVHVGEPFGVQNMNADDVVGQTRTSLQPLVDRAFKLAAQ